MDALHLQIEAFSASYSYPFLKSGTQLTLPAPPFSSILGNLSACAGRSVRPEETQIAYEFESNGRAVDLERTKRLQTDKKSGRLSDNPERGVAKREFHVRPKLDIYLTEIAFESAFYEPAAAPCLGRSQDLGWVNFVRRIQLTPAESGRVCVRPKPQSNSNSGTVLRFPNAQVGGLILPPLVDFYTNGRLGFVREAGRYTRYQFIRGGTAVKRIGDVALYHPSDSQEPDHIVVLHNLLD